MNQTFNISFVCDYMVVLTSIDVENELTDERLAKIAGEYVEGNYGFNPFDLCHDYEINEV